MRTLFLCFAALLIVAQFGLAGAEQVIDTNDSSGVTAINTNEPSITPDSFFWGIKNALDKVSLALTFNPQSKAEKGLQIAQERLLEFQKMAEEGKIGAAEKAKQSHGEFLEKAKIAARSISRENKTEEIEQQIEIEKKVEELENVSERTENNIKVKIKTRGNLTAEQKVLVESLIASMQNQTGSLKIEIKENKERIKVEIKQKTGKSEGEIEKEIEGIEKGHNLTGTQMKKASEKISGAKEEIARLEAEIAAKNITDNAVLVLLKNSREKLSEAENAFNASRFGDAYGLANAAEHLAENARDKIEKVFEKEEKGHKEEKERNETGERGHEGKVCIQVITPARNERTGECREFPTPCDVPEGWKKVDKCPEVVPSANRVTAAPIVHNTTQPDGYIFCSILVGDENRHTNYLADCSQGYENQKRTIEIYLERDGYWRYKSNNTVIAKENTAG